jgi:3-oxoacyl-[acyl-carrier-protein] synthase II
MHIALTGMGVVSPIGLSVQEMCSALLAGDVGIRRAPWAPAEDPHPHLFGAMDDRFDARDWMDDRVMAGTDGFARFALAASAQAVEDSGLDPDGLDPLRTGVVHGTSMGGLFSLARAQWALDRGGPAAVDPKTMIQIWPNMAAAQICMRHGLHGPSMTVTTACASSLDALGTAAGLLETGRADVVLCGASEGGYTCDRPEDAAFVPATSQAEAGYGMETTSADPRRAMLPFDANRSGIVSGEGSAYFVLESAAHASRRGARIHAWLSGYSSLADSHHPSSPQPDGRWEALAMEGAQAGAGVAPGDIDALVAHATGTPKGDEAEIRALNTVFEQGGGRTDLVVTALKGNTGHTGAASGAMNVIAGVWAMHHGSLPAVAGTTDLDPEIRFDVVLGEARSIDLATLQVNSFGFGGQNASVVVTRE